MIMNSLVKLSSTPSFTYDWTTIEDHKAASAAKSAVNTYKSHFASLKEQAAKLVETNTIALSRCVLVLKESLQRGEFDSVCEQALKLSRTKAYALAAVGIALQRGEVPSDALQLLNQMEPQAAAKLIKLPAEDIRTYVSTNQETGRVPSQRDFINRTKDDVLPSSIKKKQSPTTRMPTSDFDRLTAVMQQNKISAADLLKWLATAFSNKEPSEATKALVYEVSYAVLGEK